MDLDRVASILNELLSRKRPTTVNSSWILRHAPACYRFIQKWVRAETGGIDWDQVTYVLDPAYQRRWKPRRRRKAAAYTNSDELARIMCRYRPKLYVFINPVDADDRRTRDTISIALVRVAQRGNILARKELMELVRYTIENWIEHHAFISRWRGYEEELVIDMYGIQPYTMSGGFIWHTNNHAEHGKVHQNWSAWRRGSPGNRNES